MMTQATTTRTNTSRRAHPAAVRAALRSCIAATQGGTSSRNLLVTTDNTGQASVYFTTGKQSGFANNVVRASAADIPEEALFYATAQAGTAARINADMLGVNQRAEAGAKVLEPLLAIVTDAGDNRVAGVSVIFKVEEGDASFDGQPQIIQVTDKNGIASARPTMGLIAGQCRITATVDQVGATAFIVTSLAASNQPTGFSGVVLNDRNQPLAGVTLSIGRTPLTVTADAQGKFTFDANVPAGKIDLFVDGRTASGLSEVYPALHFEVLAVRGQDNQLPHPIFMPPLNTPETKTVGGDQDVVLRIPGIEGFQMKVFANSVTFPDGTRSGPLVVSRVNQDKLPMVPPGGASIFMAPAWTIQPASTRFDPPIQVTIPNSQGLKAGESSNIYQWDHDLATFVPIGRATVNEDASFLVTDAGSGVTKAGWGGGQPNPPLETCGKNAPPKCTECQMLSTNSKCLSCVPLAPLPTISITASPEGDAEFLSSTTITATATLTGDGDSSKIKWEVTSLTDKANGILAPTPASKTGGTFSFMADNVPSTTGIYTKTDPLKFEIKATYCTASATTTIEQDEKDIIRQEYRDFTDNAVVHTCGGFCNGVFTFEPPSKGELNLVVGSTHFTQAELKTTEYNHTRGTPGTLADQVRSAYNSLINDDVQAKALGTTGLNETDVVVSPGAAMQVIGTTRVIGAALETSACNGAPNPATCDDKVVGNTIVAGANGIAETVALNQPTNYGLKINSGWRNPRRNLIVNGAPQSKHLLGNAIDMKPVAYPPGKTKAMTFCILQKAAKQVASVGIAEILSRQVKCDDVDVTHVHTQ